MRPLLQGASLGGSLRKHPDLIPLVTVVTAGVVGAVAYGLRVLVKSPDISLKRPKNPEPFEAYRDKQYKLFSPGRDPLTYHSPAPNYKEGLD